MRCKYLIIAVALLGTAARSYSSDITGQATISGRGPANQAVVYLEGEKRAIPLAKAVIDQRNKMFLPHVSVITLGTTIEFPNHDTVFHNVFAYFDAKKFDLGMYPRGASKSVKFEKKGLVSVLCNVHSEMSAYIMIVDTPYYAISDRQGRYQIKDVSPGTYVLHAWHESGTTFTRTVTIKAEPYTCDLALTRK